MAKKAAKKTTKKKTTKKRASKKKPDIDHEEIEMLLSLQAEEHKEEELRHKRMILYVALSILLVFATIVFLQI